MTHPTPKHIKYARAYRRVHNALSKPAPVEPQGKLTILQHVMRRLVRKRAEG